MPASPKRSLVACFCLLLSSSPLLAEDDMVESSDWSISSWTFMTSLYTRHFDDDPDHVNDQNLISAEAQFNNGWTAGLALFDNSFGQNSQFLYMGRNWQIRDSDLWYVALRGGLLHGYKEPYEDKIPLNGLGVAPAILPALGFKYRFFVTEVQFAGTAAVVWTAGFHF